MTYSKLIVPTGFIYGSDAAIAVEQGQAAFVAGGNTAFTSAKIIHRGLGKIEFSSLVNLMSRDDLEIKQQLDNIMSARSDICGLPIADSHIMGILNITPDSFSDGGNQNDLDKLEQNIDKYIQQGLSIVDIGGESTRPNASYVSCDEEIARLKPVLKMLKTKQVRISVDTRKAKVMQYALANGAHIINDVSALEFRATKTQYGEDSGDSEHVVLSAQCPVILMHSQGTPETMQNNPKYDDILFEIYDYLQSRIELLTTKGMTRNNIIVDPGIGFGKTAAHCLEILNNLSLFHSLGVPVLVGSSRKSFMVDIVGEADAKNRMSASLAAMNTAHLSGVQFHRMHDIVQAIQFNKTINSIHTI